MGGIPLLLDGVGRFSAISGFIPMLPRANATTVMFLFKLFDITVKTGFSWEELPVTYLGLPLISRALNKSTSRALFLKYNEKLQHLTTIFLSFAGRLQLINAVLRIYNQ